MARLQRIAGWLLSSLGVVLLVCSLLLVPQNSLMANTGGGGSCPNAGLCDKGCQTAACGIAGCTNVIGCNCNATPPGLDCSPCNCLKIMSNPKYCECQ